MRGYRGLVCVFAAAASLALLSGCSFAVKSSYLYPDGDKYTAGDREITDRIETVDIDYGSGEVKLTGTASDTVMIRETAKKELDDQRKVHTWVDGTTLHVRYCASARGLDLNSLGKKLEITIPEDVGLAQVHVEVSSAAVDCSGFTAEAVNISASSGHIAAACAAGTIRMHASSGSVTLDQSGESEEITIDTSSGNIVVNADHAGRLKLSASSGSVTVDAAHVRELCSETSSGDGEFRLTEVPETTDIETSSGDVTIRLPEDAGLTAEFEHSSGKLSYELPFAKQDDVYVSGSGNNHMKVETSSGDISIMVL